MVQRRVEKLRDEAAMLRRSTRVVGRGASAWFRLCLNRQRQPVEKLPHARRQRAGQLVERPADVLLERRGGETFDQGAAEIERAQLREGEAGLVQATERAVLERPVTFAIVELIVEGKPRRLERLQVAPDRARGDASAAGQIVDRQPP
jgi:hypothetical protein